MKKVLVFGGSGFVGSHVVDALVERGYDVTVFDRQKPDYFNEAASYIEGDIGDRQAVEDAVEGNQVVYNFAGIADIDEASEKPVETTKINVLGNVYVLEACKKYSVKRFVYASTVYVFSEAGSFYKFSKQASEQCIVEYQKKYGLDFTVLRYGTLYGNRADPRNSIHRYLKQAFLNKKIEYLGDEEFLREYIHVEDAARLSVDILSDEFINEYVILTGNQQMRVKELFEMINDIMGHTIEVEYKVPTENHYRVTPYSFNPKLGKKLVGHTYYDLGQGLLKCLQEIHDNNFNKCMQKPKVLVFDFDGVILESVNIKTEAFKELFADYPEHIDAIAKHHEENGGVSRYVKFEYIYKNILGKTLTDDESQELGSKFSEIVYREILQCPHVKGALEFLEECSGKIPLYICSGTPEEELKDVIQRRGMTKYFTKIFGAPESKSQILRNIMDGEDVSPADLVFVGDASTDLNAAKETGVVFVGRNKTEIFDGVADIVINDMNDMKSMMNVETR